MPQIKKDDYGRFYGIRLRSLEDKKIKTELLKLSKQKKIPLDRLTFALLEKALNLNEEKEINVDKKALKDGFEIFFDKIRKKIISLENKLRMKNYEKKESLENYISKKFPDKIQKQKFYLELIETQIHCETELFLDFFSLYDYKSNEFVGYSRYVCEVSNLLFTIDNLHEIIKEYATKLYLRWFYELKTAGVIRELNDFKEIKKSKDFDKVINYDALEVYIFDLYEGKKLLYSQKEERIKSFAKLDKKKKKKSRKGGLKHHLNKLFRELVKYHKGLSFEKLLFNEGESQDFYKIGYKPHVLYDILDLDGYVDFIEKNDLTKALANCLSTKSNLYEIFLNYYYNFPPTSLIYKILSFLDKINILNAYLEGLPEKIEGSAYSTEDLVRFVFHFKVIDKTAERSYYKEKIDKIPIKKLSELCDIIPKNYDKIQKTIKDYLIKHNINLESLLGNAIQYANQRMIDEKIMYFKLYPDNIRQKIINSTKDLLDLINKKKQNNL